MHINCNKSGIERYREMQKGKCAYINRIINIVSTRECSHDEIICCLMRKIFIRETSYFHSQLQSIEYINAHFTNVYHIFLILI